MDARTREQVQQRAGQRCEYCHLPERADEWPFHVDHIIAKDHHVDHSISNLAWACTQCNLHKGTNFASIDPQTIERVDLFNPREDTWNRHFSIDATGRMVGISASGRATVHLLHMNDTLQLALRRELLDQNDFE